MRLKTGIPGYAAFLLLACLMAVLAGCGVYDTSGMKTRLLPEQEIAERFTLDRQWWLLYGDEDLNALVDLALARNLDLAQSAIGISLALYRANLLGADLVPVFSAATTPSSTLDLDSGTSRRSFPSELAVGYEVDLWNRLHNAASAQEWEYRATIHDREAVRLALIGNTVDAYFELRYLNEAIAATQASIERYRSLLALTQSKYEVGKVGRIEPLQARESLLNAEANLASLRSRKAEAEALLGDLLNIQSDDLPPIAAAGLLDAATAPVDLDVPVAALAARPDIHAAESRLQGAFKSLQAEKMSWYPTISLSGALGTNSSHTSSYFDAPYLMGSVRLAFPFLQWNTVYWNIKISEAEFESAKLAFIEAVTSALNEVGSAYAAADNAKRILEADQEKYLTDLGISAYYRNRYELGAEEFRYYLEALNAEDAALISVLNAKYSCISYENLIYRLMGGRYQGKQ